MIYIIHLHHLSGMTKYTHVYVVENYIQIFIPLRF